MKSSLTVSAVAALFGASVALHAQIQFQNTFSATDYTVGEINGQQGWVYTPSATRLQSSFVTVNDATTIGGLSINQRNLFIDANRTAASSSRRMDQWLKWSFPQSVNNPVTYYSFQLAVGNSGTTDNSEVFFMLGETIDTGSFGGPIMAFKTSAVPSGSGINVIEIGSGVGGDAMTFAPSPALAQETLYTITMKATISNNQIVALDGWLNPTLVDGVPVETPNVSHTLLNPKPVPSSLHIRSQSVPTAITSITVAVPEPSTYALLGALVLALAVLRRRQ